MTGGKITDLAGNLMASIFFIAMFGLLQGCGGKAATRLESVFYPPLPQNPRVQFLTRIQNSDDLGIKSGGFRKFVTGEKKNKGSLIKPHSVVFVDGRMYVCDSRLGEVVIMDIAEKKMSIMGAKERFSFGKPLSIAVGPDGTKYIADNVKKRVFVFDADDKFAKSFGKDGQFGPTSVAVHGDKLYVADIKDHEVEILNRFTGELLQVLTGSEESETGVFVMPANLFVDNAGNLYVSDLMAGNIHVFDSSLNFVRNIGSLGDRPGNLGRPRGIAVDSAGFLYVSDAAFENVQVFGPEGGLRMYFGGPGTQPGNMYLPSGLFISYDGLDLFTKYTDKRFELEYVIFVANQYGPNGISIYGFGHGRPGYFESGNEPDASTNSSEPEE